MGLRGFGVALITLALTACVDSGGGSGSGNSGADGGAGGGNNGGGGNNNGGGGGNVPSEFDREELAATLARATCDFLFNCGWQDFLGLGDKDACVAGNTGNFADGSFVQLEAAIADGRVSYDATKARACLEAFATRECNNLEEAPTICEEVFVGSAALGDPCEIDEECAEGYCELDDACPGTCVAYAPLGESCADVECERGLDCDENLTCVEYAGEGEPCGGDGGANCGGGIFVCDGETEEPNSGTCRPLGNLFSAEEGQACNPQESLFCEPGLSCVLTGVGEMGLTWECRARAEAVGADCFGGVPNHCPDGTYCAGIDFAAGMTQGTCTALPGEGDACLEVDLVPPCGPNLDCGSESNTCVARARNGTACNEDDQCFSERCVEGTCGSVGPCE